MTPTLPQTTCTVRVRYAETDGMGIVYYANYLTWFEVGRSDLLRQLGASYRELENKRIFLPVIEAHCQYLRPAHYDDVIEIRTTASRLSRVRIHFEYEISRPDDAMVLASGSTVHVATNSAGKPCRLPDDVVELFQ